MVLPWKRGPVDTRKTGNPRINNFGSGIFLSPDQNDIVEEERNNVLYR